MSLQLDQQKSRKTTCAQPQLWVFVVALILSCAVTAYALWLGRYGLAGLTMLSIVAWVYPIKRLIPAYQREGLSANQQQRLSAENMLAFSDEVSAELHKQLQYIQTELLQLGRIIADASCRITGSFHHLQEQVGRQEQRLRELRKSIQYLHEDEQKQLPEDLQSFALQQDQETSRLVNKDVSSVVQALQFEDIVQQMITRMAQRVAALDELMNQVSTMPGYDADEQSANDKAGILDSLRALDADAMKRVSDVSVSWEHDRPEDKKVELF
jgi:hypothetical protein